MLLSANMIRIHNVFGMKETFGVFAKAGIQGIDFNNDVKEFYSDEHDEAYYHALGGHAAEVGVAICQAHAPFPSSYVEEEKTQKRFEEIKTKRLSVVDDMLIDLDIYHVQLPYITDADYKRVINKIILH